MKNISVYLHKDRADILKMFGDNLSDVVNKVLDEYDAGNIDIEDIPECENRQGASRYDVTVTNETYLTMLKTYGPKSKRISLRRILYWFVDNEMYDVLGWDICKEYQNDLSVKINKRLDKILDNLYELEWLLTEDEQTITTEIRNKLRTLRR
jgi:hypothetical protein